MERGVYSLFMFNSGEEWIDFGSHDIPISEGEVHAYSVDWAALSQGEEGVTLQIDSDGDGTFEKTITADNELTRDEFMPQVPPREVFPMWIVGAAVATVAIATAAITVFWRRQKQPATKG